ALPRFLSAYKSLVDSAKRPAGVIRQAFVVYGFDSCQRLINKSFNAKLLEKLKDHAQPAIESIAT
ncbi:MAG: hypothetical protein RR715_05600, partial [Comamonas sp.]